MEDDCGLLLANRRFIWGLLARGFAEEPDGAFVDVLRGAHAAEELALVRDEWSDALEGALSDAARHAAGDLGSLRQEYVRIFVGPGVLHASPWETMHLSGRRVLFQPEVLTVRGAYREAGFLPERYPVVADDFIGLECDFMAKLADETVAALADGDVARCAERLGQSATFLDEHLGRWAGSLAEAVAAHYGPGLYEALTRLAALAARRDAAVLAALREEGLPGPKGQGPSMDDKR